MKLSQLLLLKATVIYLGGTTSGGQFNPGVSTMFFLKGDLDMMKLLGYVAAQVLGGATALRFNNIVLV